MGKRSWKFRTCQLAVNPCHLLEMHFEKNCNACAFLKKRKGLEWRNWPFFYLSLEDVSKVCNYFCPQFMYAVLENKADETIVKCKKRFHIMTFSTQFCLLQLLWFRSILSSTVKLPFDFLWGQISMQSENVYNGYFNERSLELFFWRAEAVRFF